MLVKVQDAPAVLGGKAVMLCDDDGEALPMQSRVILENGADGMATVTVTFHVDGEAVRIVD